MTGLLIEAREEIWPLKEVFRISRGSHTEARVVVVTVSDGEQIGRGEGVPLARYGQSIQSVLAQIESTKKVPDLDRDKLQQLLLPGAARNALDCALWDLEAKRSGKRVWELANFPMAHCSRRLVGDAHASRSEAATTNSGDVDQVETSFTISLDTPDKMGASAAAFVRQAERKHDAKTKEGRSPDRPRRLGSRRSLMTFGVPKILKLKLGGDELDLARVESVRDAAPAARLFIDANESWSPEHYQKFAPMLKELGVELIEQPFPAEADSVLETLDRPVPVCADESCHTTTDLPRLMKRYEVINVKLDKTGGLTEALRLCERARDGGFKLLIGCMVCTSLAIAPARLLASATDYVDLDGPLLLAGDRDHGLAYENGRIGLPSRQLWG